MGFFAKALAIVGVIAGAVLVATGIGAPWGTALIGMSLGAQMAGAAIVMGLVGAGVGYALDSALDIPKMPSATYDGDYPYPTIRNDVPIADAFGMVLVAGNLLRVNDPSEATWIKMDIGHCLGPIDEYLATYANKREFSQLAAADVDGDGKHYCAHGLGTDTATPLQLTINGVVEDLFEDRNAALRGLAHSIYKLNKESKHISGSAPGITEIIRGRRLLPISTNAVAGDKAFSRNLAVVIWDHYKRYDDMSEIEDGLIGYWAFNESSGLVAADSSSFDNPGALPAPP